MNKQDSGTRVRRAAIELFAERGFHGTGIRDLATRAGMSSASLYHHMGTKQRLLAELMETALRRLLDGAAQAGKGVTEPTEGLGRLVALHVLTHATRPAETRVVDNEVAALEPSLRAPIVELRDDYERLFTDRIRAGIDAGTFHTRDPGVARLALLEMCNGVARWYSPHGTLDVAALATQFAHIGLRIVEAERPAHDPDIELCLRIVAEVWGDAWPRTREPDSAERAADRDVALE